MVLCNSLGFRLVVSISRTFSKVLQFVYVTAQPMGDRSYVVKFSRQFLCGIISHFCLFFYSFNSISHFFVFHFLSHGIFLECSKLRVDDGGLTPGESAKQRYENRTLIEGAALRPPLGNCLDAGKTFCPASSSVSQAIEGQGSVSSYIV